MEFDFVGGKMGGCLKFMGTEHVRCPDNCSHTGEGHHICFDRDCGLKLWFWYKMNWDQPLAQEGRGYATVHPEVGRSGAEGLVTKGMVILGAPTDTNGIVRPGDMFKGQYGWFYYNFIQALPPRPEDALETDGDYGYGFGASFGGPPGGVYGVHGGGSGAQITQAPGPDEVDYDPDDPDSGWVFVHSTMCPGVEEVNPGGETEFKAGLITDFYGYKSFGEVKTKTIRLLKKTGQDKNSPKYSDVPLRVGRNAVDYGAGQVGGCSDYMKQIGTLGFGGSRYAGEEFRSAVTNQVCPIQSVYLPSRAQRGMQMYGKQFLPVELGYPSFKGWLIDNLGFSKDLNDESTSAEVLFADYAGKPCVGD